MRLKSPLKMHHIYRLIIFYLAKMTKKVVKNELEVLINDAKRRHSLNTFIKLPQLVIDPDNAVVIPFRQLLQIF